jgi:hypothetical protein
MEGVTRRRADQMLLTMRFKNIPRSVNVRERLRDRHAPKRKPRAVYARHGAAANALAGGLGLAPGPGNLRLL